MINKEAKIYIAGHTGMVGSAIHRRLKNEGYSNFVFQDYQQLDLRNQLEVADFFENESPDYVFMAAAKVGGIYANNTYPADFIYDNLLIQANIIHQAYRYKVKKLLFLGSSCIYPKFAPQPIPEQALLTGPLETTNEAYAIAKIAGIKMCQAYNRQHGCKFISVMPTNLYGPNDSYDLSNSHVVPALIRKFFEAKEQEAREVEIWGTGTPRREFLHVDDLADACVFLMNSYNDSEIINIGTGQDITIHELALLIQESIGFEGKLKFDTTQPDGTPRKLLNVDKINNLGWSAKISLVDGIRDVCKRYANAHRVSSEHHELQQVATVNTQLI